MSYPVGGKTIEQWSREIGHKIGEGKRPVTAYRWIESGFVAPVNINGRLYITEEADKEFWKRAAAGEFQVEVISVKEKAARLRAREEAA